jgi:hypothetical protein
LFLDALGSRLRGNDEYSFIADEYSVIPAQAGIQSIQEE